LGRRPLSFRYRGPRCVPRPRSTFSFPIGSWEQLGRYSVSAGHDSRVTITLGAICAAAKDNASTRRQSIRVQNVLRAHSAGRRSLCRSTVLRRASSSPRRARPCIRRRTWDIQWRRIIHRHRPGRRARGPSRCGCSAPVPRKSIRRCMVPRSSYALTRKSNSSWRRWINSDRGSEATATCRPHRRSWQRRRFPQPP
jgi:hypothetical protein